MFLFPTRELCVFDITFTTVLKALLHNQLIESDSRNLIDRLLVLETMKIVLHRTLQYIESVPRFTILVPSVVTNMCKITTSKHVTYELTSDRISQTKKS